MNEIPLSLYIFMCVMALFLLIFSLIYRENFVRIITSLISTIISYVNAEVILNGNVVLYQTTGTTYSTIPITVPGLNYLWMFLGLISFILMILYILDLINLNIQSKKDQKEAEDNGF